MSDTIIIPNINPNEPIPPIGLAPIIIEKSETVAFHYNEDNGLYELALPITNQSAYANGLYTTVGYYSETEKLLISLREADYNARKTELEVNQISREEREAINDLYDMHVRRENGCVIVGYKKDLSNIKMEFNLVFSVPFALRYNILNT